MNRRMVILLSTALLLIPLCLSAGKIAFAGDVDTKALVTVEKYLGYLVDGNIGGLKSLLSPELLRKKESVLDSLSYDERLRSRYKNATFTIVGSNLAETDRIKVDAEIILESGHLMEASFILIHEADGNYLIDEEVE